MLRYDRAFVEDFKETDEGYLTINACPITRPGVFPYMRSDGSIEMEAKLPEELFSEKTIVSAQAKPITDDHPSEPVTAANYQQYAKGMTHTDAIVRDNKLMISFTVTDADTIQKVKAGKRELSIGFSADIERADGMYNGQKYDAIQKNMEINHIAIVDKGRAGPSVAIRGDSAFMVLDSKNKNDGGKEMSKIRIDSKEYEVDATVKSHVEALTAKLDSAEMKAGELDTVKGERDALLTKVQNLEAKLEEEVAKIPKADELDSMVAARMELVQKATSFLGDSLDVAGKTDRELKEAVIQSVNPDFKGDGKTDEYVDAFFDSLTTVYKKDGFAQPIIGAKRGDSSKKTEEEIEEMKKKRMNMNKKEEK